jgi:hypothetical protein
MSITKAQIKIIHVLKTQNGLDDELYRLKLKALYGVESSKNLNFYQAADLITRLGGVNRRLNRPEYASNKQVSKIIALFYLLGFGEAKRKEWLFRAKSLNAEMNVASLHSSALAERLKAREATALIASLIKLQRYLEKTQASCAIKGV